MCSRLVNVLHSHGITPHTVLDHVKIKSWYYTFRMIHSHCNSPFWYRERSCARSEMGPVAGLVSIGACARAHLDAIVRSIVVFCVADEDGRHVARRAQRVVVVLACTSRHRSVSKSYRAPR